MLKSLKAIVIFMIALNVIWAVWLLTMPEYWWLLVAPIVFIAQQALFLADI